jgi:hypothetical protein
MTTIIPPMAYRRYRHSITRSSRSERKLLRMTGNTQETEFQLKAKSGELRPHRISPLARGFFLFGYFTLLWPFVKFCVGLTPSPSISELDFSAGVLHGVPAENIRVEMWTICTRAVWMCDHGTCCSHCLNSLQTQKVNHENTGVGNCPGGHRS